MVSHVEDTVDTRGHQLLLGVSKVTRHVLGNEDYAAFSVDNEEKPIEGLKEKEKEKEKEKNMIVGCVMSNNPSNGGVCVCVCVCDCSPLAAWAPVPLSPPAPGYWRRCRSSAPHHLETEELLSLSGGNKKPEFKKTAYRRHKQCFHCRNFPQELGTFGGTQCVSSTGTSI